MARRAVLGTVGKPFGVAGDVYVWLDPDVGEHLQAGLVCDAGGRTLEVTGVRRHRGRPVVRFAGVDDREAALALRGVTLEVDRELVAPGDGGVWVDDLLGREVVDRDGTLVGVVEGAMHGAAHDFLVIARPDGGEVLVPAVDELVDLSDPVVVHGPPGLLDPEASIS